jgi:di- and tripeptidase
MGLSRSCRQGAHLLKKILSQLGAQAEVVSAACTGPCWSALIVQLSGEQGRNPLVLATFSGPETDKPRKRVLFYGEQGSGGVP